MFNTAKIVMNPEAFPAYRHTIYVGSDVPDRYVLSCSTVEFARKFLADEYPNITEIEEVAR